jgi:hypothetical protein
VVFAGTAAAKVEREFFYLFARLRVEGDLPYRHPAVVAGVGMVLILWSSVDGCPWGALDSVVSMRLLLVGRAPGCGTHLRGRFLFDTIIISNIY